MTDNDIIELFWQRSELAVAESSSKYGAYCRYISMNILQNSQDSEECLNDVWLHSWTAIPPYRPVKLRAFFGKLTRELALNRYRDRFADKRVANELALTIDELDDCLASSKCVEDQAEYHELGKIISEFLRTQPEMAQKIFLLRYWYFEPINKISKRLGTSESSVKSSLFRTRRQLKSYLERQGVTI